MNTKLLQLFISLLLLIIIINSSCKKENTDKLPPISQTGANTFGCIINGEILVPTLSDGVPSTPPIRSDYYVKYQNPRFFYINAADRIDEKNGDGVRIYIPNIYNAGSFNFKKVEIEFIHKIITSGISCSIRNA